MMMGLEGKGVSLIRVVRYDFEVRKRKKDLLPPRMPTTLRFI